MVRIRRVHGRGNILCNHNTSQKQPWTLLQWWEEEEADNSFWVLYRSWARWCHMSPSTNEGDDDMQECCIRSPSAQFHHAGAAAHSTPLPRGREPHLWHSVSWRAAAHIQTTSGEFNHSSQLLKGQVSDYASFLKAPKQSEQQTSETLNRVTCRWLNST